MIEQRMAGKFTVLEGGCWRWDRAANKGYGVLRVGARMEYVHRLIWAERNGPVPEGRQVDHYLFPETCIGSLCVNPDHLRPATTWENSLRSSAPWSANRAKEACLRGHAFDPVNTRVAPDGERVCRACCRLRMQAARRRARVDVTTATSTVR